MPCLCPVLTCLTPGSVGGGSFPPQGHGDSADWGGRDAERQHQMFAVDELGYWIIQQSVSW